MSLAYKNATSKRNRNKNKEKERIAGVAWEKLKIKRAREKLEIERARKKLEVVREIERIVREKQEKQ